MTAQVILLPLKIKRVQFHLQVVHELWKVQCLPQDSGKFSKSCINFPRAVVTKFQPTGWLKTSEIYISQF